jgi:hypothetical protein
MDDKPIIRRDLDEVVGQISGAVLNALENVATKDDLKKYATKDDLKNLVTKDDLEKVKGELKDEIAEVKKELMYVKSDVRDLKADTPTNIEFQKLKARVVQLSAD